MDATQSSSATPAFCDLFDKPAECFAEYRKRLLTLIHPWNHIPCTYCKFARINAVICHVPEPDDLEPRHFFVNVRIDPRDFMDIPEPVSEKRGPKRKKTCKRGHLYKKHGFIRKDGRIRCRKCESERKKGYYAKGKAA